MDGLLVGGGDFLWGWDSGWVTGEWHINPLRSLRLPLRPLRKKKSPH